MFLLRPQLSPPPPPPPPPQLSPPPPPPLLPLPWRRSHLRSSLPSQ